MHEMEQLLSNWLRLHQPTATTLRRMRAQIDAQIHRRTPPDPQHLIASVFARAFSVLQEQQIARAG